MSGDAALGRPEPMGLRRPHALGPARRNQSSHLCDCLQSRAVVPCDPHKTPPTEAALGRALRHGQAQGPPPVQVQVLRALAQDAQLAATAPSGSRHWGFEPKVSRPLFGWAQAPCLAARGPLQSLAQVLAPLQGRFRPQIQTWAGNYTAACDADRRAEPTSPTRRHLRE